MKIAIDFDHTLVDGNKPLPGAKQAMQQLWNEGHILMIFSANNKDWIEKVLGNLDIPYHSVYEGKGKPICDAYIDDRGIGFNGSWSDTLHELSQLAERRRRIKGLLNDASTEAGTE